MINISLRNINKYYKDKIILDNINLDIESSNIYMILGKSGAGKSTLLNIIGLLDTPNSGNISIKGKVIKNLSDNDKAEIRMKELGFVFQGFFLNPKLKAYENAIELVKILLKYHNFTIDKVVQHNKWSGKDCPQLLRANKFGYNWDWFIKQCKGSTNQVSSTATFKSGDYTGKKAKVTANVLNIRFDRGTQYDVIGKLKKGDTVKLNYCLNGWISIEGYKGNAGLGYVNTDYLELI